MVFDDIVEASAQEVGMPQWWIRNVITEYLPCRRFADEYPMWRFDQGLIETRVASVAAKTHKVVMADAIVHNVRRDVFTHRLAHRMFSSRSEPLSSDSDNYFPEGLVGPHNFEWSANPIESSDPKLHFSRWFQAKDEDGIFQWEVARFETVEGRHFGRWVSDHVDLSGIEEIDIRSRDVTGRMQAGGEADSAGLIRDVEEFYSWVESVRAPIRDALWNYHEDRKNRPWKNTSVAVPPPLLSSAEDFTVEDGALKTSFNADALFFDVCRRNAQQGGLHFSSLEGAENILFARVEAIVNAAACLEAFVNSVGSDLMPEFEEYDRLSITGKWRLCLRATGQAETYDASREPFQTLQKVVYLRNLWMHDHREYRKVRSVGEVTVTWIEAQMDPLFIKRLPDQLLELMRGLSVLAGKMPGWLVPVGGMMDP